MATRPCHVLWEGRKLPENNGARNSKTYAKRLRSLVFRQKSVGKGEGCRSGQSPAPARARQNRTEADAGDPPPPMANNPEATIPSGPPHLPPHEHWQPAASSCRAIALAAGVAAHMARSVEDESGRFPRCQAVLAFPPFGYPRGATRDRLPGEFISQSSFCLQLTCPPRSRLVRPDCSHGGFP